MSEKQPNPHTEELPSFGDSGLLEKAGLIPDGAEAEAFLPDLAKEMQEVTTSDTDQRPEAESDA